VFDKSVLYQGTTSVIPEKTEKQTGFSPEEGIPRLFMNDAGIIGANDIEKMTEPIRHRYRIEC